MLETRLGVSGSIFFSPLYGMPILKADKAKSEDICKKSLSPASVSLIRINRFHKSKKLFPVNNASPRTI